MRFIGRFDERDAAGPIAGWPGVRIVARFDGTEVSASMAELTQDWMQGGPSEWDVTVDGEAKDKLVLAAGTQTYALSKDLTPGPHTVELYKRSEAQNGSTQFLGFDFGGGALLPPPLPAERRIEIIGDSQPAAFGIEGSDIGPDCPWPMWAAKWQNFHRSFGALLGESFQADVAGTVYSGKGLAKNIYRTDPDTLPKLYGLSNPVDESSVHDPASFVPDAIVLMVGGNDFAIGQPYDDGPVDVGTYTSALQAFVTELRADYPKVFVFLTVSPSVSDDEPPGRASRTHTADAMRQVAQALGEDGHVTLVTPAVATPAELTGCNGHGTPAFHQRLARELAVVIAEKLGW